MIENSVWIPHELPLGKRPLDSRWIFSKKRSGITGEMVWKARLCLRGFRQRHGEDFFEIYAPTCRFEVIRLLLCIAVQESLVMFQADVIGAFLQSPIDAEVYILRPEGYDSCHKHLKLLRSCYGMRQSPRCFYRKMKEVLAELKFTPTSVDPCVFIGPKEHRQSLVLYVDDMILFSKNKEIALSFLKRLEGKLEIKYGPLRKFLGIQIDHIGNGLFLHQTEAVTELVAKYKMNHSKPAMSPLDRSCYSLDETKRIDDGDYRRLIGSLNFLVTNVRPDISFSVSWLSRFLDKSTEKTWTLALRVLKYLKGTANYGITFSRKASPEFEFYSDSNYASDPLTRRSVTGIGIFSSGGCILLKTQLQRSVTLSSCESELIALSSLAQTAQFIKRFLKDLDIEIGGCLGSLLTAAAVAFVLVRARRRLRARESRRSLLSDNL